MAGSPAGQSLLSSLDDNACHDATRHTWHSGAAWCMLLGTRCLDGLEEQGVAMMMVMPWCVLTCLEEVRPPAMCFPVSNTTLST